MNNKGFIHVLEAIIVSLLLILVLPFLLFPNEKQTAWDVARLTTIGEDALATLDGTDFGSDNDSFAQDVLEENSTNVDNELRRILGTTSIGYGLRARGSLKNEIRVGCNCTQDAVNALEQGLLSPTFVNGRLITFRVFPFELDRLDRLDFDVLLVRRADVNTFNNFYNASRTKKGMLSNHLRRGRGIVELADIDATALGQSFQREVIGIQGGAGGGGNVGFTNANNVSAISYKVGKYFYGTGMDVNFTGATQRNLTLRTLGHPVRKNVTSGIWGGVDVDANRNGAFDANEVNISESQRFSVTLDGTAYNFTVDKLHNASNTVHFNAVRGPGEYNFSDFVGADQTAVAPGDGDVSRVAAGVSGGRNALIVRTVEGGRAAWLSEDGGDDVRGLLKATVLWAAGDDWNIIPRSVSGRQVKVSRYVVQGEDFSEPYWLELTLWFLF